MNRKQQKESRKPQDKGAVTSQMASKAGAISAWKDILNDTQKLLFSLQVCVFFVAFLVFANGIPNGFNIDDSYYTTPGNPISGQGIKAIPSIFSQPTLHIGRDIAFGYRPVTMLTFALQHEFLGDDAAVSHTINVLLYAIICTLIFSQLNRWLGHSKIWFAFLITLLYAVHPLHTEVVNNIKCRDELLAHLFCWLSVASIWKWSVTDRWSHLITGLLLFLFALLCKEDVITFAFIIPTSLFFYTDMHKKKSLLLFVALVVLYFAFPLSLKHLLHLPNHNQVFIENPFSVTRQSWAVKTATASYILGWYGYLHIIPYPLSFYYGYKYVQLVSWQSIWPILSLLGYVFLFVTLYKNLHKKNLIAFGISLYLISILPFSNLVIPAPGLMSERFTFESSLGYAVLIVATLNRLYKGNTDNILANKKMLGTFACIFLAYAGTSVARNTQWKDSWTLYNHDMRHLTTSAKANLLYNELVTEKINGYWEKYQTVAESERAIYKDSINLYAQAQTTSLLNVIDIWPNTSNVRNNLAVIYTSYGNFELAKKYMEDEMAMIPRAKNNATYHYNLGWIYENLSIKNKDKDIQDSAITEYRTAIRINPANELPHWKLSQIYMRTGDTTASINVLLNGAPKAPGLYMELGNIYSNRQDTLTSIVYYEKAAAATPNPPIEMLQYLQDYYHNNSDPSKENYYKNKIIEMNSRTLSSNELMNEP